MDKLKKTLGLYDLIGIGENAGETVETCVKKYGKKSLLNVLKYYNLSEKVMEIYHFHLTPHQENPNLVEKKDKDQVSKTDPVEEFVSTTTQDWDEENSEPDEEVVGTPWYCPVDYDPEDDNEFGNYWMNRRVTTPGFMESKSFNR